MRKTITFEINENGNIVINDKEYQLVNADVLYNITTLPEVICDEDLNRPIEDIDSGDEYTLGETIQQLKDETINPGNIK